MQDLAIDFLTGDLKIAPNNDVAVCSGPYVLVQRVHLRLKVKRGAWLLDPTNGNFGSTLQDSLRFSVERALIEMGAAVREALSPMTDIVVDDVSVTRSGARSVLVKVQYRPVSNGIAGGTTNLATTIPII